MAATITLSRDEVARMNSHLSDNNIDHFIELGVLELTFDYGGAIRMNEEQQEAAIANGAEIKDDLLKAVHAQVAWTPFSTKPKARIYKRNRLSGMDDSNLVRGIGTPRDYWLNILERYPPQQGYKVDTLVDRLAMIAPNQQPSESKVYASVKSRVGIDRIFLDIVFLFSLLLHQLCGDCCNNDLNQ